MINLTELMNIQDFSERTGISKSTLRYYEQKNLLIPSERSANGYRVYSNDQIATVKFISSLRLADIPIKDIKVYLDGTIILPQVLKGRIDQTV